MGTILTDLGDVGYEHEGYLAAILPDGTDIGSWTNETPTPIGHRPACSGCDWRGTDNYEHPGERFLDEDVEDELMAEWVAHVHDMAAQVELAGKVDAVRSHSHLLVRAAREALNAGVSWDELLRVMPYQLGVAVQRAVETDQAVRP